MAIETSAEITTRLTEVRAAISRSVLAASYSIAGRSHSNQQLSELRKLERDLMRRLARLNGTGGLVLAITTTAESEVGGSIT